MSEKDSAILRHSFSNRALGFVHVWILRLITNHPLIRWYQYTGCRKNDITPIYCLIKLRKKKRHHSISLTFFVSCLKLWQNRNTISRRLGDIMSWCLKETHSSSIRSRVNNHIVCIIKMRNSWMNYYFWRKCDKMEDINFKNQLLH